MNPGGLNDHAGALGRASGIVGIDSLTRVSSKSGIITIIPD
jgi:hypothetical protein